jgi:hypothetical protein
MKILSTAALLLAIAANSGFTGMLENAGLEVDGFLDVRAGMRTQDDPYERDTSLSEARLQLTLGRQGDLASFYTRTDFIHDDIPTRTSLDLERGTGAADLREAYLLITVFQDADIKMGRQIMTWGTGDLLFINDLFPKDWQAFFNGRDTDYLKAPSDALFVSYFPGFASINMIYTPRFDPDRYISGDGLSYWNPMLGRRAGTDAVADPELPDSWLDDDEIAMRIYRDIGKTETALYFYDGCWKSPAGFNPDSGRATFPALSVYGISARRALGDGLFNLESGYYESSDDSSGSDPYVPNSEMRFLAGYEREIARDLTMGLQYYIEHMLDYSGYTSGLAEGQPARDKDRHVTTLRLMKRAMNQNLTLAFFVYYSPSDRDTYMRPSADYKISDQWSVSAGGNIFTGSDPYTFFAQFENNSNIYGSMRYSF